VPQFGHSWAPAADGALAVTEPDAEEALAGAEGALTGAEEALTGAEEALSDTEEAAPIGDPHVSQ